MPGILDHLVNPPATKSEPIDFSEQDDFRRTVVRGALAEQEDQAKAEEAEACRELRKRLEDEYRRYIVEKDAQSDSTLRQYTISCKQFLKWCDEANFIKFDTRKGRLQHPADPVIIAAFLNDELKAGVKPALIRRHVSAISWIHRFARLADPTSDPLVRAMVYYASTKGRHPSPDEH
jgi:hypothetical protein